MTETDALTDTSDDTDRLVKVAEESQYGSQESQTTQPPAPVSAVDMPSADQESDSIETEPEDASRTENTISIDVEVGTDSAKMVTKSDYEIAVPGLGKAIPSLRSW